MSKASQAFLDIYGTATEIEEGRLTALQKEALERFGPLVKRVDGMEMHGVGTDRSPMLLTLVVFRPARNESEFEITLDIDSSDYLLQFDGYEFDSNMDYERPIRPEDGVIDYLYKKVTAALEGKIKLVETSTDKGPFRWEVFEKEAGGSWESIGVMEDWPLRPFAKKSVNEKIIKS